MFAVDGRDRGSVDTLQEQVYQQLRRLLMTGHFRPGQAFKIRDIAESFSTSMQPVREAIRQLIAEGALEASPNASTRVPRLTDAQMEDLCSIRIAVEGLAAERAVARMKKQEIRALEKVLSAEPATSPTLDRVSASVLRNIKFHFLLYSHSGSELLPSIIEGLWLRVGPSIRDAAELFDSKDRKDDYHHLEILRALREQDALAVRNAIERDIVRFFTVLRVQREALSIQHGTAAKTGRAPRGAAAAKPMAAKREPRDTTGA